MQCGELETALRQRQQACSELEGLLSSSRQKCKELQVRSSGASRPASASAHAEDPVASGSTSMCWPSTHTLYTCCCHKYHTRLEFC